MKFAICQELFENWDWDRQCAFSADGTAYVVGGAQGSLLLQKLSPTQTP